MQTIAVTDNIIKNMAYIPGSNLEEKLSNLMVSNFTLQLRECEEALFRYEAKYGMGFDEFSSAWDAGEFDRYSHEIERDFMEWEGFCQERGRLLGSIKEMRRRVTC
jgi:hypothetical protein